MLQDAVFRSTLFIAQVLQDAVFRSTLFIAQVLQDAVFKYTLLTACVLQSFLNPTTPFSGTSSSSLSSSCLPSPSQWPPAWASGHCVSGSSTRHGERASCVTCPRTATPTTWRRRRNGRVQVRRDITDEFSCCVPGLFCGGSSSSSNSSNINSSSSSSRAEMDGESSCLRHLVQNSSLIFVEGFVTTIQPSSSSIVSAPPAPDRREDVAEERRLVRPHELLTVPPRRNTPTTKTNGRRRRSENPPSGQRAPDDNGPDGVPETKIPLIRTCSDPALSTNPLPKRVISSSSSILSAGSSHEELFQRARGFFLNRVLLADRPQLSKSLCGEDGHEEGSRLLSTEMCSSVFRAGISLQVTR